MDEIKVLIVEDDPRISEIHRRFTEKVPGFRVIGIANSLAEAEDLIEVLEADLILLDIYFPDGNGIDLLWKLRAHRRNIDLILLTAAKEIDTLKQAIRGGVFDYLLKPVVFARFQETMQRYRQSRGQLARATALEQQDVDHLLRPASTAEPGRTLLPKGIDPITLAKVANAFAATPGQGLSAEQVAGLVGLSRSSARRYLEHLVAAGSLRADLVYGSVGRPERHYFRL